MHHPILRKNSLQRTLSTASTLVNSLPVSDKSPSFPPSPLSLLPSFCAVIAFSPPLQNDGDDDTDYEDLPMSSGSRPLVSLCV